METNSEIDGLIEDTINARDMAEQVDFLNSSEKKCYASVLIKAMQWGRKKDRENEEYFSRNHLVDKYNV